MRYVEPRGITAVLRLEPVSLGAAAIAAGASLAGTGASALATAGRNKKQRRWQEKMYDLQHQRNIELWNMQNSYNHPSLQMARLRDAGLNANLMYGQGTVGNSPQMPSAPTPGNYNPEVPDMSGISNAGRLGLSAYYDTQVKDATIENLKIQGNVLQADVNKKNAEAIKALRDANMSEYDLTYKQAVESYRQMSEEWKAQDIQNSALYKGVQYEIARSTKYASIGQAFRKVVLQDAQIRQSKAETDRIYQSISNLEKDGVFKQIENEMAQNGVFRNDPIYIRLVLQNLKERGKMGNNSAALLAALIAKEMGETISKSIDKIP